jgi:hypothetical protein
VRPVFLVREIGPDKMRFIEDTFAYPGVGLEALPIAESPTGGKRKSFSAPLVSAGVSSRVGGKARDSNVERTWHPSRRIAISLPPALLARSLGTHFTAVAQDELLCPTVSRIDELLPWAYVTAP